MSDKPLEVHIDPREHLQDKFPPHGQYHAELQGHVVHARATGPLNLEALQLYAQKVGPLIAQANALGAFVWLTEFRNSMLMPLEAIDIFAAKVLEIARGGAVRGAAHVVAADTEGRALITAMFASKVFGPAGIPYRVFNDLGAAEAWLQHLLTEPGRKAP